MKIIFLTDSYGGPRIHNGIAEVCEQQTYPELVKKQLESIGHQVIIDYASYRRIIDIPDLMETYPNFDIYILQAGIVDLYPRPLSYNYVISKTVFAKLLRRLIRLKRSFFLQYVYSKPWTTEKEVEIAIEKTCNTSTSKLVWINVAPVNQFQEIESPGASKAIITFNTILKRTIGKYINCFELDIYKKIIAEKDYESLLHKTDSHLNINGNNFYANHLLTFLSPLLSDKD